MIIHRCLSCKEDRQMKHIVLKLFKNGQPAVTGVCIKCGSKMVRMLPKLPKLEVIGDLDTD